MLVNTIQAIVNNVLQSNGKRVGKKSEDGAGQNLTGSQGETKSSTDLAAGSCQNATHESCKLLLLITETAFAGHDPSAKPDFFCPLW